MIGFETKIMGYDAQTNCDCCGRPLKIGVRLSGLGTFGADCIRAAVVFDRKRYSQGRPGAAMMEMMEMMMAYEYRVKASTMSVYVECFQEVKEAVMEFIKKNDYGVVYEKIGGKDVIAWRFDPYYGMVRA